MGSLGIGAAFAMLPKAKRIALSVVGIVAFLALVGSILWGMRVDHLRGEYRDQLVSIGQTLEDATVHEDIDLDQIGQALNQVIADRDHFKRERDNARAVLATQSETIRAYEAETNRLRAISERNAELAAAAIRDRDMWIARAEQASTRTERLSAEEELRQCEEVLNALYEADF